MNAVAIKARAALIEDKAKALTFLVLQGVSDERVAELGRNLHDLGKDLVKFTDDCADSHWLVAKGYAPPWDLID